ncbi:MAG: hypothetical protein K5900_11595 [Butyrivibrio sp.]|nr:hypothetical protein [Butyrivibrio sp.]
MKYEVGSEFNYIKPDMAQGDSLPKLFEQTGRTAKYLRCGRDAIGFIAEDIALKQARKGNDSFEKIVYMPALSCDSMVEPFRMHGYKVVFYKLEKNLKIAKESLLDIDQHKASFAPVILTMNLFSMADQRDVNKAIKTAYPQAIIVEDITHILLTPDHYDLENADYQIGSIRKWFGLADGAVVLTGDKEFLATAKKGETSFTTMRTQAMTEKTAYIENPDQELKAHFRGLLSDADDALDNGLTIYEISEQSYSDIQHAPVKEMMERRSENYHHLYKNFEEILTSMSCDADACKQAGSLEEISFTAKGGVSSEKADLDCETLNKAESQAPFYMLPEAPADVTPFMLPILVNERVVGCSRDEFERKLAQKGVYAPVLWPIEEEAARTCAVSKDFSEHMLGFWIDHRYTTEHMDYVAEVFKESLQ